MSGDGATVAARSRDEAVGAGRPGVDEGDHHHDRHGPVQVGGAVAIDEKPADDPTAGDGGV